MIMMLMNLNKKLRTYMARIEEGRSSVRRCSLSQPLGHGFKSCNLAETEKNIWRELLARTCFENVGFVCVW